jgi:hypothetical protein
MGGPAMAGEPEESPDPKRSVAHRIVFGACLVLAGLFLVASIALVIIYAVMAAQFFSGGAD